MVVCPERWVKWVCGKKVPSTMLLSPLKAAKAKGKRKKKKKEMKNTRAEWREFAAGLFRVPWCRMPGPCFRFQTHLSLLLRGILEKNQIISFALRFCRWIAKSPVEEWCESGSAGRSRGRVRSVYGTVEGENHWYSRAWLIEHHKCRKSNQY